MIVSSLGPRVLNRRRNKKFTKETRDQRYRPLKSNGKRNGGRKPRKLHKPRGNSKYYVLGHIQEESCNGSVIVDVTKFKTRVFTKLHKLVQESKPVEEAYPIDNLRAACDYEFQSSILPNLSNQADYTKIDPSRLFSWVEISRKAMPEDAFAQTAHRAFSNYSKHELFVLQKLFAYYPKLMAWKESDYGRNVKFGEKCPLPLQDAKDFAALGADNDVGFTLYRLNPCFRSTRWDERLENLFHEAAETGYRSRTCADCKEMFWECESISFDRFDDSYGSCGSTDYCSACVMKIVKENRKSDHVKGTFCCGKECGCFLNIYPKSGGLEFFEKELDLSRDALLDIYKADFKRFVIGAYEKMPAKILKEPERHDSFLYKAQHLDRMRVNVIGLSPQEREDYSALKKKVEELITKARLKTNCSHLDKAVDSLFSAIKDSDSLHQKCQDLLRPIRNVLSDRPPKDVSNAETASLGFSTHDVSSMKLQRAKDALNTAYSISTQCSICMTESKTTETRMLSFHMFVEDDVDNWNYSQSTFSPQSRKGFKLPCHTCEDCFSNYLKHKKALGKPALKCPGMNCGCHLKESRVKAVAPVAYADYQVAMMRYALKRVKNYRTCPNADCSAGLVLDIDCSVEKVTCSACNWSFCPHCNDTPHEGISCEDMRRKRHAERWGDAKDYMENETKQCPYCLAWIEKNGGCDHMTCHHCRGEFCWLCFGEWKTHRSCTDKKAVVRRPFNELFPDWQLKSSKVLLPRFSVGKYVILHDYSAIGRVTKVESDGVYVVEPVNSSFAGYKKVEESRLRGYNGPIPSSIDSEEAEAMEDAAYASFLSGFVDDESDEAAPVQISVELTTCIATEEKSQDLTAKELLQKYAKHSEIDSKSLKLLNQRRRLKTLKDKRRHRAKIERNREKVLFETIPRKRVRFEDDCSISLNSFFFSDSESDSSCEYSPRDLLFDSDSDSEDTSVAVPSYFWDEDPFASSSDSDSEREDTNVSFFWRLL